MNKVRHFAIYSLLALSAVSVYVFSRYTVDDAFISWRYGKNLIDFGIWNYNPTNLDLTQSYTSPVYAVFSIIPNYFGVDVVLFFKILSIALGGYFSIWFLRISKSSWGLLLSLLAIPATVVHIFGGLETFLFVFLMGGLLIALYEERLLHAFLLTLFLFVTRPEAWLLVVLVPAYFAVKEPNMTGVDLIKRPLFYIHKLDYDVRKGLLILSLVALPLIAYFGLNYFYFGYALPNTYYVKSASGFSVRNFFGFGILLIPVALLLITGRVKLTVFMFMMFGAMAMSYSTSNLQMNYAGRFSFHIFAPIYIFLAYLSARAGGSVYVSLTREVSDGLEVRLSELTKILAFCLLFMFAVNSGSMSLHLATYYPRALVSHAALGKILGEVSDTHNIRAFSFGDAGMAAYHSKLNALDNIGLGSAEVAHNGLTFSLLDNYELDLVVFHSRPEGIRFTSHNQQDIYDWTLSKGFHELCDVYWQSNYTLKIYARNQIEEISDLCHYSKVQNDVPNRALFRDALLPPPWRFWLE